ncbi:MAG: translation elongation factor Ts [Mycoplasmataceae bacterium]|nr:translation elongation factor Ts [Mycoplasmataceae bacterium]
MANIELLKKLRDLTQAGVLDAKKALDENHDDLEASIQWLREKGIAKAAKKAGAIATEGVTKVYISGDSAVIFELNCETDFVGTNSAFVDLANDIGLTLLKGGINDYDSALNNLKLSSGMSIDLACKTLTGKIGEKILLRRFQFITKKPEEMFSSYEHSNHRIAVLLTIDKNIDQIVAKDIAMHAAAMAPTFMNPNQVDKDWLANETKILREQAIAEGKPIEKAEMIIRGRINKLLGEVVLESQPFVKNPKVSIKDHLSSANGTLLKYIRFQVGEGIEKKVVDFAAEVASQIKK